MRSACAYHRYDPEGFPSGVGYGASDQMKPFRSVLSSYILIGFQIDAHIALFAANDSMSAFILHQDNIATTEGAFPIYRFSRHFSVLHNVSQEIAGLHFLDRVPGYDLQPLHQRPVLFRRDFQCLFFCTGPAETARLQPFVEEKESVPFPDQPFHAVTASTAEQEEDILFVWIQLEVEFHNGCQPVNATPQVRIAGSNVNLPESGCVIQHEESLLSAKAVLPKRNSRSPGQGSLSGSQDPDGKRVMRLVAQQEV